MKSQAGPAVAGARNIIDAATLKDIARLAKIDATKPGACNGLFVNLRAAIDDAWSATLEPSKSLYQAPVLEKLSSWRDAIATIKKLSNPDSPAGVHALGQIRAFLSRINRGALYSLEDNWGPWLDDLDRAAVEASEFVRRKYQLKGHPPGGGGNVEANIFITSLLYAIDAAGGNLTFSRVEEEGRARLLMRLTYFGVTCQSVYFRSPVASDFTRLPRGRPKPNSSPLRK